MKVIGEDEQGFIRFELKYAAEVFSNFDNGDKEWKKYLSGVKHGLESYYYYSIDEKTHEIMFWIDLMWHNKRDIRHIIDDSRHSIRDLNCTSIEELILKLGVM